MVVEKGKVTPPSVERVNITLLLVPTLGLSPQHNPRCHA